MSLSYRISVSESESRVVVVDDGVCSGLQLLEILPREEMTRLLQAELQRRGFLATNGGNLARAEDGVVVSVDIEKRVVSVSLGDTQQVELTRERMAIVEDRPGKQGKAIAALRSKVLADIEHAVEDQRAKLRSEVTARLETLLPDLRREIDAAVNRVTADALKVRAAQIGEIQEVIEEPDGSLTIKVRT